MSSGNHLLGGVYGITGLEKYNINLNMNIKKIIKEEIDKKVWGIELPKKVSFGDDILTLTDRGVYQGGDIEVEYCVDGDDILTLDGDILTPVNDSDFVYGG